MEKNKKMKIKVNVRLKFQLCGVFCQFKTASVNIPKHAIFERNFNRTILKNKFRFNY